MGKRYQRQQKEILFLRMALLLIISLAFAFGFIAVFSRIDFDRLHIFLFNLCCGGFTILYITENRDLPSKKVLAFLILSIVNTVLIFLEHYCYAIPVSLIMVGIVERVRLARFPFFPIDFFRREVNSSRKFHQASILCLSLAILISIVVILNNHYFHWIYAEKLSINVFFLGFSFPVSLITLSTMFGFIEFKKSLLLRTLEHSIFWIINLGVIIFFLFILLEVKIPEIIIAFVLAISVCAVFILFFNYGMKRQQKLFLVSGMIFLLFTAITGVAYIIVRMGSNSVPEAGFLLTMHSYVSLYGWNLSGMLVILRSRDFPLKLNSFAVIALHWIAVGVLAPLGTLFPWFSVVSIMGFILFLMIFLTGQRTESL